MKETTLPDVYRLMAESVRFYEVSPNTGEPRPETFGVIDNEKDLTSESLGYTIFDKNKPHFFSRAWEQNKYNPSALGWKYPALVVYEENMIHEGLFTDSKYRYWSLSLNCLVQDWNEIKGDEASQDQPVIHKTRSEFYVDAENILLKSLRYIQRAVIASTTEDATERLYNVDYLEYRKANVPGFDYTVNKSKRNVFGHELNKYNSGPMVFNRIYLHHLKSVCVFVSLKVPVSCYSEDYSAGFYTDYGVTHG